MEEQKLLKKRKKAQKDNNEQALVSACTDLANLYMEQGRFDFAIEEYAIVANVHKKQNKKLEYAVANRGIGEAYLGLLKFDKALQHQRIYLDIARELKNKLEEQRALATIGHTYLSSYLEAPEPDKSNLDFANKFFKKSLVVSQSLNGQASKLVIADMSARLFSNLGLVQDCMGNYTQACELITKSIQSCIAHDLYEQLQRAYISLASVLMKKREHKLALQQYNLAAEAAKKLRNKPVLLATILSSKSDILVKLGDLQGAKNSLLKAYKLKIPDVKERKTIESNLRTVASMCYNEEKLLTTDTTDYATLKVLYEKMGDGACDLKQFEKALDYYKKMLDCAFKADLSDSDLGSCYYSLAETYKDNGQFKEAVTYFEKELELCKQLKDSLNTLSKIADTKEAADDPISEVRTVYNRAIELCKIDGNIHEEGRMLKRLIIYLRRQKQHCDAFDLEQNLEKLDYQSSDSESESCEAQGSVVGADIDLDAITDVSDDSDLDQPVKSRRRHNFQVKRNVKGETQLHTACIKGQLNVVSHLLEQGHPVNVRDNCGWLPLHEACINGHYDVVKLLLEKGAAINDREGTHCEGITPLHDAASNGHLHIVQLLLSKGANAIARTDEGETVLSFLRKWRSTVNLDEENEQLYEEIIEQVSQVLDKSGHMVEMKEVTPTRGTRRSALIELDDEDSGSSVGVVNGPSREETPTRDLRRSAVIGLDDDDSGSSPTKPAHEYKDVIESLRYRTGTKAPARSNVGVAKRPALLIDMTDDWLEDDIGKTTKKRKTNSPAKSHSSRVSLNDSFEDHEILSDEPMSVDRTPKKFIRKKQAKLTTFGHTRTLVEADSTTRSPALNSAPKTTLNKNRSFEMIESTLSVDVRINKKLYRVPVLLSQVSTHSIKWLAEEAAARYARKEYMMPTLELETKNGALLADDDSLNILFPLGATQAEEVEGRIVKWSVPPLIDRYKEACQNMTVGINDVIGRILEEFTVSLDLSNRGLKGGALAPLCKVLSRQNNLLELDLSGNFLTDECLQFLGASLPLLESLLRLSLNCTGLQTLYLQNLVSNMSPDVAYKIIDLDLSDNDLEDQSFDSLVTLTQYFRLKKLNLSGNKFSSEPKKALILDQIEDFDISDNNLSNDALLKILSWLTPAILKTLSVSRNSLSDGFLQQLLSTWTNANNLKICKMSMCHVTDSDLFDLLRIANSLEILDVSYNKDLTSVSLRRMLQSDIQNLTLHGCQNILKYFTNFCKYLGESSRDDGKGKTLKISLAEGSDKEREYLIDMWRGMYGTKTVVELSRRFLCLSVKK